MNSPDSRTNERALVVDTGPLLALARIDSLETLFTLFHPCWITHSVVEECLAKPDRPDALRIQAALSNGWLIALPDPITRPAFNKLGSGEQSALELASQRACYLLLDDKRARRLARDHETKFIGVPGLLLLAKQEKLLDIVQPKLRALIDSGYFLKEELVKEILRRAGE